MSKLRLLIEARGFITEPSNYPHFLQPIIAHISQFDIETWSIVITIVTLTVLVSLFAYHLFNYINPTKVISEFGDVKTNKIKRTILNSHPIRVVRYGLETTGTFTRAPIYLSPWGGNNFFTIPTIRVRDLFTSIFGFLIGPFIDGALVETVTSMAAKKAADKLLDFPVQMLSEKANKKIKSRTNLKKKLSKTIVSVKGETKVIPHGGDSGVIQSVRISLVANTKLVDGNADLDFWFFNKTPVRGLHYYYDCSKGWFNPYLYSTQRLCLIDRFSNPDFILFKGPTIEFDHEFPLQIITESNKFNLIKSYNSTPTTKAPCFLVTVCGITPFRGIWSQSRRPKVGELYHHFLKSTTSLLIPLKAATTEERIPMFAWHSRTLRDIQKLDMEEIHCEATCAFQFLKEYVDFDRFLVGKDFERERVEVVFEKTFENWFFGIKEAVDGKEFMDMDPENAGLIFMRVDL